MVSSPVQATPAEKENPTLYSAARPPFLTDGRENRLCRGICVIPACRETGVSGGCSPTGIRPGIEGEGPNRDKAKFSVAPGRAAEFVRNGRRKNWLVGARRAGGYNGRLGPILLQALWEALTMGIEWFFQVAGETRGPVSAQELRALAEAGTITPDTRVKRGGDRKWVSARRVEGLFEPGGITCRPRPPAAAQAPPPLPPALCGSTKPVRDGGAEGNGVIPPAQHATGQRWNLGNRHGAELGIGFLITMAKIHPWSAVDILIVPIGWLVVIGAITLLVTAVRKNIKEMWFPCTARVYLIVAVLDLLVTLVASLFFGALRTEGELVQAIGESVRTGTPPPGVPRELHREMKREATEPILGESRVEEQRQSLQKALLDWLDEKQDQPLPEIGLLSSWGDEIQKQMVAEVLADPEIVALFPAGDKYREFDDAAAQSAFEEKIEAKLVSQWTPQKHRGELERRYRRWREEQSPSAPEPSSSAPVEWELVSLPEVCTFRIPPRMEVQRGLYGAFSSVIGSLVAGSVAPGGRVVIQPRGINKSEPEALESYARVIVEILETQEDPEVIPLRPGHLRLLSADDLKKLDGERKRVLIEQWKSQKVLPTRLLEWKGTEVARIGNVHALKSAFRKQLRDELSVLVRVYTVPRGSRICQILVSFREAEELKWGADLEKVLSSFEFKLR